MTPQELKNSILQLAIQGKLVEQRPEEGTAAELVEKILAAKNAKSAKKNLTRSRGARGEKEASATSASLREKIPDDEKPFDIPESWEWVRLGEVASIERGSGIKRSETSSSGFPCVRYGEIYTTYGYSFTSTKSFVTENVASSCHKANYGDVLCTLTGEWKEEIAKATAYLGKSPIAVGGDLAKVSSHVFNPVLLVYFFFAPFMIQQKASKANGTMIVHIGKEAVSNLLIPLPPLAEQKRIVAKIEELLPLIDRYEKAWSKLEDFNKRFPVDMQKSLLQMAIQGKLVDQRLEEGTGEELAHALRLKKNELIQSGQIAKKPKTKQFYTQEELCEYGIPDTWCWVQLSDVSVIQEGAGIRKWQYRDNGTQILCVTNILEGAIDLERKKLFISTEEYLEKYRHLTPQKGDIVSACSGGSWGKTAIFDCSDTTMLNTSTLRLRFFGDLASNGYLYYLTKSAFFKKQIERQLAGMQPNFGYAHYSRIMFPLPPLAEQKRIVAKLEELLPLCERLKSASNSAVNP